MSTRRTYLAPFRRTPDHLCSPSQRAFEDAIVAGRLSHDPESPLYAGNFMFMYIRDGIAQFKHRDTREYLP